MTTAIICPRDNLVGFVPEDEGNILLRSPSTGAHQSIPLSGVVSRYPDCTVISVSSEDDAAQKLEEARNRSATLDFALMMFDNDLPLRVRQNAAEVLSELLVRHENRDYVLDVVLASPLPTEADTDGALEATTNFKMASDLVKLIIECRSRSKSASNAWLATRAHRLIKPEDRDRVRAHFIRSGVFRRVVSEGRTQAEVEKIVGQLAVELNKVVDARIIRDFVNDYRRTLPVGTVSRTEPAKIVSQTIYAEEDATAARALPTRERTKADDLASWAAGQVDSIADRYRVGDDVNAEKYLDELVESQTQGTAQREHVVKSLCNLSTQCNTVGREELCMPILHRAFQFSSGVDARAFTLLADEFFRAKDLEKADECYSRAEQLETDSYYLDSIRRKRIRVSIARGEYDTALQTYESLTDIVDHVGFLTDKGTLYRRMARFQEARSCFRVAIGLQSDRYQAFAGIAEVDKQCGKLYRSLHRYNDVLRKFDSELDLGSKKVYQLAQAFLFQLTRNFQRSHAVLWGLHQAYGLDRQVNFQLGKLLVVMGQPADAKRFIERSQRPGHENLGDELFALATGKMLDFVKPAKPKELETYLPEDRGLATCGRAFDAILRDSFEEAWDLTSQVSHHNRLHEDFGRVLGYHARKKMNSSLSYKREQPLARIAKRGYQELRLSVRAIEDQDFDSAIEHERRMLQLVA